MKGGRARASAPVGRHVNLVHNLIRLARKLGARAARLASKHLALGGNVVQLDTKLERQVAKLVVGCVMNCATGSHHHKGKSRMPSECMREIKKQKVSTLIKNNSA